MGHIKGEIEPNIIHVCTCNPGKWSLQTGTRILPSFRLLSTSLICSCKLPGINNNTLAGGGGGGGGGKGDSCIDYTYSQ